MLHLHIVRLGQAEALVVPDNSAVPIADEAASSVPAADHMAARPDQKLFVEAPAQLPAQADLFIASWKLPFPLAPSLRSGRAVAPEQSTVYAVDGRLFVLAPRGRGEEIQRRLHALGIRAEFHFLADVGVDRVEVKAELTTAALQAHIDHGE